MPLHVSHALLVATLFLSAAPATLSAQSAIPAVPTTASQAIGFDRQWTGLAKADAHTAELTLPGIAVFQVPAGPKGWHRPTDYEMEFDGVLDVRPWHGIRFEVKLDRKSDAFVADLTLRIPPDQPRNDQLDHASTHIRIEGNPAGWHTVTVPFASFDYNRGQQDFLQFIQTLEIQGRYEGSKPAGRVTLRNLRLVLADVVSLASPIKSRPADVNGAAEYPITITNCGDISRSFALSFERTGWEAMAATVTPATLALLQPGERRTALVRVTVPAGAPAGAREDQILVATSQAGDAEPQKLVLTTLQRVPFPFLVHDATGWAAVRAKVDRFPWAREQADDVIKKATAWQVPVAYPNNRSPEGRLSVFAGYAEGDLRKCVLAWRLTGDRAFIDKAALFLRRLADPATGYPRTLHANSQNIPQEGGLFEGCVEAYEAAVEAGVLSAENRQLIETTFRLYIGVTRGMMGDGGISNWTVFNLSPAALCALAIQDLDLFNALMDEPCGIVDHLRYGMMNDGWWYEMALSYNLGCAEAFTKVGLAARAFGIDFLNQKFPVALTHKVGLRPFEFQNFQGMAFGKYGPARTHTTTIKQMWDGITPYPDYRGVMFGMGDGHEDTVGGGPFELAYYAFRDPAYAAIIKQGGKRDLVYGVPDLPTDTPTLFTRSSFSENAGIAVLRSQTPDRAPSEQIQAAFKYGTHGSYHGHFDRISLLSLMRHGRSFYHPETSWFGYPSYMYKWWVQPSLSHNMVVVDAKQQEPRECTQLLFHSGAMMQAVAAETVARWSNPPYFGGYDQLAKVKAGDLPYVPIPVDHPKPADVTDYSEPVRQRRAIIVTDDYVVLADDLRAEHEHTYDNLLHLRGARLVDTPGLRSLGHQAQFDTSPLGSGQFITDVNRYTGTAPLRVESLHRIDKDKNLETGGKSSESIPGDLRIDEHILWPQNPEILLGRYAEAWNVNKKLTYDVLGDGRSLATDTFGAWMLGSGTVDVDVRSVTTMELRTVTKRSDKTRNTLFWGNPVLVTADGREVPLATLTATPKNVIPTPQPDHDYEGGPIVIAGEAYTRATPAEPKDTAQPAVITVSLVGLNAVRFKATVGGDWPVGDEENTRKTISVRSHGTTAQFLTLLEPYETRRLVKTAVATGPNRLRVELTDGRIQELVIQNLDGDHPVIELTESRDGQVTRRETTAPTQP